MNALTVENVDELSIPCWRLSIDKMVCSENNATPKQTRHVRHPLHDEDDFRSLGSFTKPILKDIECHRQQNTTEFQWLNNET